MKLPRLTLRLGFHVMLLLALLLVLLSMLLLWYRQQRSQDAVADIAGQAMHGLLADQVRLDGEAEVQKLAEALVNPMYFFDLDAVGVLARTALREQNVSYVLVYDADGHILHDGSGDIAAYGQPMDDPLAAALIAADTPQTQQAGALLDVSYPIMLGEQRLGGVRIGYALDASARAEALALSRLHARIAEVGKRNLLWLLLLCAGIALLGLAAAALMLRLLVQPIRRLGEAARRIEDGDFSTPIPTSRREDELGDLIRAFNRMRDSVARHDRDIRRAAYSDSLTGLGNRLAFREALEQRTRAVQGVGHKLALLFADLDDFKHVNDTLGHEAGDDVLLQVAARIDQALETVAEADAVVARLGGDEFVILLQAGAEAPGADVQVLAGRLAEALLDALGAPLLLHGQRIHLGASIGVAMFPEDAQTPSQLMKCGDIAMYQAKLSGKRRLHFYSRSMDLAAERRMRMERDLHGAWERGELGLEYQPIYRASDRGLAGAESLLRWHHPEEGSIPPAVFVEIAEQCGLIEIIGPQLLRRACLDAASWPIPDGSHEAPFVSVNVSPRQLRSGNLVELVVAALAESGLPAERLHLEITETAVLGDDHHAAEQPFERLRQLGVRVWLDDFGTGYSSLSHLRRIQADGLKIDRSFITELLDKPDDLALTSAILAMAQSLGITVVAEGVEREGQFALLRERGCDLVQGYWLSPSLGVRDFVKLARTPRH